MRNKNNGLYGMSISDIQRICQVSLRTAQRWKSCQVVVPPMALRLLSGDLGILSPPWRRWIVRGELLVSPEGWEITMSDVLSSPLLRMQLEAFKSENRRLKDPTAHLDEQPLPEAWPEFIKTG